MTKTTTNGLRYSAYDNKNYKWLAIFSQWQQELQMASDEIASDIQWQQELQMASDIQPVATRTTNG